MPPGPVNPGTGGGGVTGGRGGSAGTGGGGAGGQAGSPSPDAQPSVDIAPQTGRDGGGSDGQTPAVSSDCNPALPSSLFCNPLGKMPRTLKETGLFPAAPDLSKHPASMLEYAPDPALWSDGMEKQRFLLLPAGKKIDNSNREVWSFPTGTIFIKTFFDDTGPGGTRRAIETRLIRAGNNLPYEFFLYEWNQQGTDANLVLEDITGDPAKEKLIPITINRMENGQPFRVNNGQPFMHSLPSRNACGECHEENGMHAQVFIGFDELRLNSKVPATAAKTQLQIFDEAGIFTKPIPTDPATITDNSNDGGRMLRIKRFVFGNCVHCHAGFAQVDLRPNVFEMNTIGKPTEAQSVKPPMGWLRVIPRDPERSVLFVQVRRRPLPAPTAGDTMNRLRAMPPVGVAEVAADQQAVNDIRAWIMSLPPR
jgi:hypothetical protein